MAAAVAALVFAHLGWIGGALNLLPVLVGRKALQKRLATCTCSPLSFRVSSAVGFTSGLWSTCEPLPPTVLLREPPLNVNAKLGLACQGNPQFLDLAFEDLPAWARVAALPLVVQKAFARSGSLSRKGFMQAGSGNPSSKQRLPQLSSPTMSSHIHAASLPASPLGDPRPPARTAELCRSQRPPKPSYRAVFGKPWGGRWYASGMRL